MRHLKLHGRRGRHRQPQSAGVQRLQGLLGRRRAGSSRRTTRTSSPRSAAVGGFGNVKEHGPGRGREGQGPDQDHRPGRGRGLPGGGATPRASSREVCGKQGKTLKIVYTPLHGTGVTLIAGGPAAPRLREGARWCPSRPSRTASSPRSSSPNPEEGAGVEDGHRAGQTRGRGPGHRAPTRTPTAWASPSARRTASSCS